MRKRCITNSDPLSLTLPRRGRGSGESCPQTLGAEELAQETLKNREAVLTSTGALATWNPAHSTGRIPKQTFIVRDQYTEQTVDWSFAMCNPMDPKEFDRLFRETKTALNSRSSDRCHPEPFDNTHLCHTERSRSATQSERAQDKLRRGTKIDAYITERMIGANPNHALPVRTIADRALTALFTHNMFLPPRFSSLDYARDDTRGVTHEEPFELLVLSNAPNQCIAMDFHRRRGVVVGTKYLGCVKKLMFTVMNELLPARGVLPLHCSAVEDQQGDTHLFLGLSGTGKTTLSSDPRRALIGDDEHLWSDQGIANMENGCYAKLINLSREKEPDIYEAVFGCQQCHSERSRRATLRDGSTTLTMTRSVIIENAMVYPDGSVDLSDSRLTENSRASYPLEYLKNIKKEKCGGHPKTIIFLTADASGMLPPIAKLNTEQALLWFLMGYTSKLAGTEAGVLTPQSTFSRFFGGPFMMCRPEIYLNLFREKILRHNTDVYLVNTGWSGGPYGVGKRMDIALTRQLVDAALLGELRNVDCRDDPRFHIGVPIEMEGCPSQLGARMKGRGMLDPKKTWANPDAYDRAANVLANEFAQAFEKNFAGKVPAEVAAMCPGR